MDGDGETLAFYAREAAAYASRPRDLPLSAIDQFLDRLAPGARILELGCGAGADAEAMLARGFEVEPTDGSPELAAEASRRLGRAVRVLRFDDLEETAAYDGVWANASLHHAPDAELDQVIAAIWRALRPGGVFFASFKSGEGPGRDSLGRYYSFPSEDRLRAAFGAAGAWAELETWGRQGGGYDGVPRDWLISLAVKPLK